MYRSRRIHRRQAFLTWLVVVLLVVLQMQLLPSFSVTEPATATTADKSAVSAQYANLPLAFEPNQGQVDGNVSYLVHHGQATTYFDGVNTTTTIGDDHITMSLDGAATPNFTGTNQLESKTNYFIGNDQSKWHSDVPNYKQILATNVYPGIDLKYYGTNSQLEHDFIVNPGSDYKQIAFHFDGQQDLSLDKDGNLVLKTENDELYLNAPTTYQTTPTSKHTIPSEFIITDNRTITISLAADYDKNQPLIIDPTLVYSTYLGGSGSDGSYDIAVDASGSVYVTGWTDSTNFPTATPFQGSNGGGGNQDMFVTKINASGSALAYSTYIGGSLEEEGIGIAVDLIGNAYVAGYTNSTNFPTSSPFQATLVPGATDVVVVKLNSAGSSLTFSTYLGGNNTDVGRNIAVDSSGNIYVAGMTFSTNFPTASPFQASISGSRDAFVAKFNATGSALIYSTYLGGSGNEYSYGIAVDSSNNVYVTGYTPSTNFPTASPFQASNGGGTSDAFLTKFNPTGSGLVYSTYLGGSGEDRGHDIGVDSAGNAYIAGYTASTNFPTASPFQASNNGSNDAFIAKFNPSGSALAYSSYLGGSGSDKGMGITFDSNGNVYVAGYTASTNFPTASPFQASNAGGANDVFVTKFNSAGSSLVYSTYLGGSGDDQETYGISLGLNGNVYLTGTTVSTDFPTYAPFQGSNGGGVNDIFITQISDRNVNLTAQVNPTLTFTVGSTTCALGTLSVSQTQFCTYALTAATNGTSGYTISYLPAATLTSGANTITALSSLTASTLATEQFGINLRANTAVGSHTATAFGANVSGGSGSVASAYNTPDSFKLVVGGDTIATVSAPSLTSTYTVSTIANISSTTEAGSYTTTLTYNIVAGY